MCSIITLTMATEQKKEQKVVFVQDSISSCMLHRMTNLYGELWLFSFFAELYFVWGKPEIVENNAEGMYVLQHYNKPVHTQQPALFVLDEIRKLFE